jgi:hypothetical protein
MPEGPIPSLAIINHDSQFSAKEISKAEFETVWNQASRSAAGSFPDHNAECQFVIHCDHRGTWSRWTAFTRR